MARIRHLSRPPIQEAVIDFVFADSQMERDGLDGLASTFPNELWEQQRITTTTLEAQVGGTEGISEPRTTSAFEGYAMRELTGSRIVQLREDRLTVSHLVRYGRWEDLVSDAAENFRRFVEVGKPTRVTRVAARFVNRIPVDSSSFDDLLASPPKVLPELQEARVSDFVRRHVLKGLELDFSASLTVATVTPLPSENSNALLIDIDVWKQVEISPDFVKFDQYLSALRSIKNAIFFGSVTERALEPFI